MVHKITECQLLVAGLFLYLEIQHTWFHILAICCEKSLGYKILTVTFKKKAMIIIQEPYPQVRCQQLMELGEAN